MIEVCITVLIIAGLAFYLVNKWLNQRQQELNTKFTVNTKASEDALSAAVDNMHKTFDDRINKAFANHALIKQEFDSLKLSIGLKVNK